MMGKAVTYSLLFVGGIATGLLIAKFYARHQVEGGIHSALDAFGLGGGKLEDLADSIIVPQVA